MIILLTVSPHWLMCSYFSSIRSSLSDLPRAWLRYILQLFIFNSVDHVYNLGRDKVWLDNSTDTSVTSGDLHNLCGEFSFNSAVKIRISLCLALFILEDKWIVKIENQKLWDITRFWTIAIRDINNIIFFSFRRGSISIFSVELVISNILLNTHAVLEYFSGCGMEEIQWL